MLAVDIARIRTSAIETKELRPLLKWAGGKRWLVPELKKLWAPHSDKRLVEPFAGGLAVSLGLSPQRALLNDINPHLINFYTWVKRGLEISVDMRNEREAYDRLRTRFNRFIDTEAAASSDAAQIFYYLNRTGFNGLCRFNNDGFFNVPFGRYATINYRTDFGAHQQQFKKWQFVNKDFSKLLLRPGDFIYADPPYDVQFTKYSKEGFDWADQVKLVDWLAKHDGPIVLSNQATPRIVKLYRENGYKLRFLDAPRLISCDGNRTKAREVLATKDI